MRSTKFTTMFFWFVVVLNVQAGDDGRPKSLDEKIATSNYIFRGEVIGVSYKMSEPGPSGQPLPYTFVTYKVNQEIKGGTGSDTFTLRFFGGPIDEDNFVTSPHQPLMDIGEKDMLFVKGNGETTCPLVDCRQGRFREIDGVMFNDEGESIYMDSENRLQVGQAANLEEVNFHKMSDTIRLEFARAELEGEDYGVETLDEIPAERGFRPDPSGFAAMIEDKVRVLQSPEELAELPKEASVDITQPFAEIMYGDGIAASPGEEEEDVLDLTDDEMQEELMEEALNLQKRQAIKQIPAIAEQDKTQGIEAGIASVTAAQPTIAAASVGPSNLWVLGLMALTVFIVALAYGLKKRYS